MEAQAQTAAHERSVDLNAGVMCHPTMGWYDLFSHFYDTSLEPLYVDARARAAEALELTPGCTVLDLPCGTGLSFDALVPGIRPDGKLLGVDASAGMLAKAAARCARKGLEEEVSLLTEDVHRLDRAALESSIGRAEVDRLHVFLGLTAFPEWEAAFERLFDLLAPGGRAVVVDVYAETLSFQGRMVNWTARADIERRAWEPLERLSEGFTKTDQPANRRYGGTLWLASGTKPRRRPRPPAGDLDLDQTGGT